MTALCLTGCEATVTPPELEPALQATLAGWLAERTGIPALMLPLTVGGSEGATDLFTLFDDILDRLLEASGG